jgi:hypothetical protein
VTCVDRNGTILETDTTYCQEITQALRSAYSRRSDDDLVQEAIFSYELPLLPMRNATYIIDQPPTSLPIFAIRKEQ